MPPAPPSTRRRLIGVLFAGTGLARTGFIATITVGSLIAEDLLGSASLAGLPAATATIGVAMGTAPIAALMAGHGRRVGISGGMGLAAVGALIAAAAIGLDSFALFVVGMFAFGFGNAGDRLSRYAAADVSPPEQRSLAISIVVVGGDDRRSPWSAVARADQAAGRGPRARWAGRTGPAGGGSCGRRGDHRLRRSAPRPALVCGAGHRR